jgi:hypothetical protein
MRPLFTVHAGELVVGQYIASSFKDKNIWVPTKDVGIDLLVTNSKNTKALTLQVKFSKNFLPTMKLEAAVLRKLRSWTWFTLDRQKLAQSKAGRWIFVLLGFERAFDYVVIKPNELLRKLRKLDPKSERYQMYICVTEEGRAWLTRGLSKADQQRIADNSFENVTRDLTKHLKDWSAIKHL